MKAIKMMVATLLIAVMICGGAMAAAYKANVITSSMEVYNAKKEYIGMLPRGTELYVTKLSSDGNWARIYYKGHVGYTSTQNIIFQDIIKAVCYRNTEMTFVTKSSFKNHQAYKAAVAMGTLVNVVGHFDGNLLIASDSGNALGIVPMNCFKKLSMG